MRSVKQELRHLGEFDRFLEWSTGEALDWAGDNYCAVSSGLRSLEGGGTPKPGVVHSKAQRSDQQCQSDSGESESSLGSAGTRARSQQWLSHGTVGKFRLLKFGSRAGGQLCGTVHTALSLRRTF